MKIIIEFQRQELKGNDTISIDALDGIFHFNYKIKKGKIIWFFFHSRLEHRFWNDLACHTFLPLNEIRYLHYEVLS